MDNVKFHKNQATLDLLKALGITVVFVPPYSPWLNPVEILFGTVKSMIRDVSANLLALGFQFESIVMDCFNQVTKEQRWSFFRHCGYI